MTPDLIRKKEPEFAKAADHLKSELKTLRTGRASASLVEYLEIEYYGTKTPLIQMAQITVPEPRVITIQPYDKNALKEIEKAVQTSNLGINPVNDGNFIRLIVPQMTEERRKELSKVVSSMGERARVSVRNVREEIWKEIQRQEKDNKISEDEMISAKEDLQKLVDKCNEEIKKMTEAKEKEIMTI
ncbi:MAG TPA: ribosome recycling factor [Patescibacteria group bacterium]|jgi:ribosome recycling factor|nr:ribosome recycling factor [Patescibacteria group bacterium]